MRVGDRGEAAASISPGNLDLLEIAHIRQLQQSLQIVSKVGAGNLGGRFRHKAAGNAKVIV